MGFFDLFDVTYIISLPSRTDRRKECAQELAALGTAVGKSNIEFFDAIRPDCADGFSSIGVHGSLLSHTKALESARSRHAEKILLLEDDVAFSPLFADSNFVEQVRRCLAGDWDFIYFGHNVAGSPRSRGVELVRHPDDLMLAHCLAVNGRLADSLIRYLQGVRDRPAGHPEGGKMGFDPSMNMFRQRTENCTFIAMPCLAHQRPSRTDLGQHRWFDSVPMLRYLAQHVRRTRSSVARASRFRRFM